jgi:methylmalonyl-CoA mutase C-terminal domain/subunit
LRRPVHDRGAKVIAASMIVQTPGQIVRTAIQEDADGIGLSILSGAHMTLFPLVVEQLARRAPATSCFSAAERSRPTTPPS